MTISKELHDALERSVGSYDMLWERPSGLSGQVVWKIRPLDSHACLVVKGFCERTRFETEVYAYQHWAPALWPFAPQLIDVIDNDLQPAIIITSLDGVTCQEMGSWPTHALDQVFCTIGQLTNVLHTRFTGTFFGPFTIQGNPAQLPIITDPAAYFEDSLGYIYERGASLNIYSQRELLQAEWALKNVHYMAGCTPHPVFFDLNPSNWIIDPRSGKFVGMVDFEFMRWGFDLDSLALWLEQPQGAAKKFFEGYGSEILCQRSLQMTLVRTKAGFSRLLWGFLNKDKESISSARNTLSAIWSGSLFPAQTR